MSDADKWREVDLAESSLGRFIGYYSKIIYEEQRKDMPDVEKIGELKNERRALELLRRGLNVEDQAAIANIRDKYGPAARAVMKKK